ncbi:efflux transporter outer membrane subunit [Photobacterium sagamiensis]|uniref:efflux transporter outer membrane subunit n=1 Tax=Photobacterium sagamiensis TaxID=2910241 RepID=UPI003D1174F2
MKLSKLTPIVLAMVLAGCAVGPDYQPPEMTLDTEYLYQNVQGMSSGQLEEKTTWWMQFNDLTLNALVAEAQQQNIPLKMAAERIKAAQAYQQAIESFKVPTVSLGAGYTTYQFSENDPLLGSAISSDNPFGTALINKQYDGVFAGAAIAWELDLFGRIDKQAQAASIRKEQAELYRHGLTTMISADVIHNYLQMRGAQERKAIALSTIVDQKRTLQIVERMVASGYGSLLDLSRAKAMLAVTQSVIPQLDIATTVHKQRLAILLGKTPKEMEERLGESSIMPEQEGLIPTGLPSDLLKCRPDLQIAEREMAAINAQLGAAVANKYPKLFLTGTPGLFAGDFDDLFSSDSAAWIASVGVSWNLFDGGRSDAMVGMQQARFDAAALGYQQAVISAFGEVETLLYSYGSSQDYQKLVNEAQLEIDKAVSKAKSLYRAGLADHLAVLDAQRQQNLMKDRTVAAKLQTAQVAVGLHKALGGDWSLGTPD